MNIFLEKFSTGQVIAATGVPNATLQSWLKRGIIVGHRNIEGGGSPGVHRRFSFCNLMEIALAKALIDAGLSDLNFAFGAARHFAHAGTGRSEFTPERDPGLPFESTADRPGTTMLAACQDRHYLAFCGADTDAISDIRSGLGGPIGFVVVDVSELFDRVMASLHYHPEEVLEAAYAKNGNS